MFEKCALIRIPGETSVRNEETSLFFSISSARLLFALLLSLVYLFVAAYNYSILDSMEDEINYGDPDKYMNDESIEMAWAIQVISFKISFFYYWSVMIFINWILRWGDEGEWKKEEWIITCRSCVANAESCKVERADDFFPY